MMSRVTLIGLCEVSRISAASSGLIDLTLVFLLYSSRLWTGRTESAARFSFFF
jgi:hypothetical protein